MTTPDLTPEALKIRAAGYEELFRQGSKRAEHLKKKDVQIAAELADAKQELSELTIQHDECAKELERARAVLKEQEETIARLTKTLKDNAKNMTEMVNERVAHSLSVAQSTTAPDGPCEEYRQDGECSCPTPHDDDPSNDYRN